MASIEKNQNASGEIISYRIRACLGRDEKGKQIWRSCTVKRPEGLTPAKEKKEIERLADTWEQKEKASWEKEKGNSLSWKMEKKKLKERITFVEFMDRIWWPDHVMNGQHTPDSIAFYQTTTAIFIVDYILR